MHPDTKSDLISNGTGLLGSLLKELLVHQHEMDRIQEQKDLQLDLARARQEHAGADDAAEPSAAPGGVGSATPAAREAFEDLKAREECGVCRQLLDAIERADPQTQVRALVEYGRFADAVESGKTEAEIRDVLQQSDTLKRLLEQEMGVR